MTPKELKAAIAELRGSVSRGDRANAPQITMVCDEAERLKARVADLEYLADLTDEQKNSSVLPHLVDDGTVTICVSISGGADEVLGMPRRLRLQRQAPKYATIYANYLLEGVDAGVTCDEQVDDD